MRKSLRSIAITSVALLVLTGAVTANAANSDCLSTPELNSAHLVESKSLDYGVSAQAWQWEPGSDATNASLSPLGTRVSIATGNLRNISFGILHWSIPETQDLRMLSVTGDKALASLNGDYFDGNGPWNAMLEDSHMIYSPPGTTGVVGLIKRTVVPSKGYRGTGSVTVGTKKYLVTGVNQLSPGKDSIVVYGQGFVHDVTPKGQVTIVIKSGKIYKVYPKGAAVSKRLGTVIQVRGKYAATFAKFALKKVAKVALAPAPLYETKMVADTVAPAGSISSANNTVPIDAYNFGPLSSSGATLFDGEYSETTRSGRVTLRILPDATGKLVVRNVYRQGYFTKVDAGGYILQAKGDTATAALRFKAGDVVTISRGYRSATGANFINAAGRGPRIVQNNKFVWICAMHGKEFRPRSAIGWNQDGQVWLMASSRGADAADMGMRQGGSTADQMARWLMALGATDAVLLDGGGSTTMEIKDPDASWQRFDLPDSAWYRALSNAFSIEANY